MPRSILLGRPMPGPGEPLFTDEDTGYAIALAEEERDTCPSCGYPKAFCRDPANQFAFEARQEQCHATAATAALRHSPDWEKKHAATREATQISAAFRAGHEPEIDAGLGLSAIEGVEHEDGSDN